VTREVNRIAHSVRVLRFSKISPRSGRTGDFQKLDTGPAPLWSYTSNEFLQDCIRA